MRDLLFREKQQKRYHIERDEETLIKNLRLEKDLEQGRKKRVVDKIEKSINIFKEIQLLSSVEKEIGVKGQIKYIFHINKDFK